MSDLSEWHVKSSAFALVDGQPWHMHRPLTSSCDLKLLTFKDEDPQIVNQVNLCVHTSFCVNKTEFYSIHKLHVTGKPASIHVYQAYWRSCAALLGQVLDGAFKDEYSVELLKIPEVPGMIYTCRIIVYGS